jgi:hypothetical protein
MKLRVLVIGEDRRAAEAEAEAGDARVEKNISSRRKRFTASSTITNIL